MLKKNVCGVIWGIFTDNEKGILDNDIKNRLPVLYSIKYY